ncbi:Fur-regulated basic protein FbpA [Niallia sp. Krafla_26]|uniref:Fur-regulated basic protein FbpA n=1 Tax=Niallia sp. Krafla_26 TaxID=3064703 RepID=UPI003D180A5E
MEGIIEGKMETKKNELIEQLIHYGVYKVGSVQLFELSISELQALYQKVLKQKKVR